MTYTQAVWDPDGADPDRIVPIDYGPSRAQKVEWWYPSSFNPDDGTGTPAQGGKYPILIYFHGGGWNKGRPDHITGEAIWTPLEADDGTYDVIVCSVNTRQNTYNTQGPPVELDGSTYHNSYGTVLGTEPMSRANGFEGILDARRGVSCVRSEAPYWFPTADPNNVVLAGGSAGAFRTQFVGYGPSLPYSGGQGQFAADYYSADEPSNGVVGVWTYWAMGDLRDIDDDPNDGVGLVSQGLFNRSATEYARMSEKKILAMSPENIIREWGGKPTILSYTTLPVGTETFGVHDSDNAAALIAALDSQSQPWSYYNDAFSGKDATINASAIWEGMKDMWNGSFTGEGQVGAP